MKAVAAGGFRTAGGICAAVAIGLLLLSWGPGLHLVLGDLAVPFWGLAGVAALLGLFVTDLTAGETWIRAVALVAQAAVLLVALLSLGALLLLGPEFHVDGDRMIRVSTFLDSGTVDVFDLHGPFAVHHHGRSCDLGPDCDAAATGS